MNKLILAADQKIAANIAAERPKNLPPSPEPIRIAEPGDLVPLIWGNGQSKIQEVPWAGVQDRTGRSWPRRCLVAVESLEIADEQMGGDGVTSAKLADVEAGWFFLAGAWQTPNAYGTRPDTFTLLTNTNENGDKHLLIVPKPLARLWLNPAEDALRLLRRCRAPVAQKRTKRAA